MSDPTKPKLSDALKGQVPETGDASVPGQHGHGHHPEEAPEEFNRAEERQHNREVNEGIKTNKDRLIDIGRGEQAAGRHPAD